MSTTSIYGPLHFIMPIFLLIFFRVLGWQKIFKPRFCRTSLSQSPSSKHYYFNRYCYVSTCAKCFVTIAWQIQFTFILQVSCITPKILQRALLTIWHRQFYLMIMFTGWWLTSDVISRILVWKIFSWADPSTLKKVNRKFSIKYMYLNSFWPHWWWSGYYGQHDLGFL